MGNTIGIRHEDKYELERRAPLIPNHIKQLIDLEGIKFFVEKSDKRVFDDDEYKSAGAQIVDNIDQCEVVFGVKEMPDTLFRKGVAYIFFSHVIKGQDYNMSMLKNIIKKGSTLIDYERICDSNGKRLIFFGRFAGLAGMINSLWAFGRRHSELGKDTPLANLKQSYSYASLETAKNDILQYGDEFSSNRKKYFNKPVVIAITGDGNVSKGALEIAELLPGRELTVNQFLNKDYSMNDSFLKLNILPEDYLTHLDGRPFDLFHYFEYPDQYQSTIEEILPHIDLFVNGIYWDERYPRLITKKWLKKNFKIGLGPSVIGDISCDVNGSIECTEKATEIEDPVFVYDPGSDSTKMGFHGKGVAVMAVDILPSELPRESSFHFSGALKPFVKQISECNFDDTFEDLQLSDEVKNAVIVHNGRLTDAYQYLEKFIP
tara:strand:+ start:60871 stop:62166 length:1296 start_codon:yes stop_codon:yes gene_type:complete